MTYLVVERHHLFRGTIGVLLEIVDSKGFHKRVKYVREWFYRGVAVGGKLPGKIDHRKPE